METHNLLAGLLGAMVALIGLGYATALGDRVDGVIRLIALGSFVGTGLAYRRRRYRADFDPFPIITRWSYVGLGLGLLIEAGGTVL
ncbi:MAG: hypothetical protein ACR2LH_07575 [Thermoleophilaceae bacterium]